MKQRHWLDLTESVLLAGTGIGAATSLLLQQAIYAVTPLSLLVVVGLWNRNRFDAQTQHLTQQVAGQVQQQVHDRLNSVETTLQNRPSQQAFIGFQQALLLKNKESLVAFRQHYDEIVQRVNQYQLQLSQFGIDHLEHGIGDLQRHYHRLDEAIDDLTTQLTRSPSSQRVETIETTITDLKLQMMRLRVNIDHLNSETRKAFHPLHDQLESLGKQLSHLSRQVDTSRIKQEVDELIKAVTDLVPKRDFMEISEVVNYLKQQQRDLEKSIATIEDTVRVTGQESHTLSDQQHAQVVQMEGLHQEVAQLRSSLEQLASQLRSPAPATMNPQLLEQILRQIPKSLDVTALQKQVQGLSDRLDDTTQQLLTVQQKLTGLPSQHSDFHHLLFDVPRSTPPTSSSASPPSLLESVLAQAQRQLILICPWSPSQALDESLIQQFRAVLERQVRLELGWCHRGDRREGRFLSTIAQRWLAEASQRKDLQQVLNQLLPLKQRYPDLFKFKILGTNEQFLVCDREFAILGMQDLAMHNTVFPDLRVWLRTTDPEVIQRLMHRLQTPTIDTQDVGAFFNRATTRYDLSDWAGALEDYNQVICLTPTDAIAYNNRGLVRYDLNDKAGALADFTQAIHCDPHQLAAYCNRGILYAEKGDSLAAITDFGQAIQLDATSPIPYFYRGMQWQKQGHWAAALDDFSTAIAQQPSAAFVYCYRAALYQTLQQPEAAIADLQTAIAQFNQQGDTVSAQRVKRTFRSLQVKLPAASTNSAAG